MSSPLETIINLIIHSSWLCNVCPSVTEFNDPLEWQGSPGPHSIVGTFTLGTNLLGILCRGRVRKRWCHLAWSLVHALMLMIFQLKGTSYFVFNSLFGLALQGVTEVWNNNLLYFQFLHNMIQFWGAEISIFMPIFPTFPSKQRKKLEQPCFLHSQSN